MEKTLLLAAIVGPFYVVFALSILLYVKQWQKLIDEFGKNHFLVFSNMTIALVVGLILVNFYNVWDWSIYVLITITGWGGLLKGAFYFLTPASWTKSVMKVAWIRSSGYLYTASVIMLVLGGWLSYNAYFLG